MADIALAIAAKLEDAAVSDIVGKRSYPSHVRLVDLVFPLITYKVEVSPEITFSGGAGVESGTVQVAAIDETYAGVAQLGAAVRATLDNASGTWGGVVVQGCFLQEADGVQDQTITDDSTEEILYYVKVLSYDIRYVT